MSDEKLDDRWAALCASVKSTTRLPPLVSTPWGKDSFMSASKGSRTHGRTDQFYEDWEEAHPPAKHVRGVGGTFAVDEIRNYVDAVNDFSESLETMGERTFEVIVPEEEKTSNEKELSFEALCKQLAKAQPTGDFQLILKRAKKRRKR
jgi:hypothetical protein